MSIEHHRSAMLGALATPPKFVMPAKAGIHPGFQDTAASPIGTTATRHRSGSIPARHGEAMLSMDAGMTDAGLPSRSRSPQTADATTSVMPAKAGIHPSIRNVKGVPIGTTTQYVWPGWFPEFAGMTKRGDIEVSAGPAIDPDCRAQMPTSAPANRVH